MTWKLCFTHLPAIADLYPLLTSHFICCTCVVNTVNHEIFTIIKLVYFWGVAFLLGIIECPHTAQRSIKTDGGSFGVLPP